MRDHSARFSQRPWLVALLALSAIACSPPDPSVSDEIKMLDVETASRFASLALECVHREYPNKIAHTMSSDDDVGPPRNLTPSFYGCYDWHSSVHGHWLLARLSRLLPEASFAGPAREALAISLSPARIEQEVTYLSADGRSGFERPYGLAWLLQLAAELRQWDEPLGVELAANLAPLELIAVAEFKEWLPKLSHPIRGGEHSQTAFALGLVLDWSRIVGDREMEMLVLERSEFWYQADTRCPMAYEPSGHDFLSPCLAEADLMRRVMDTESYSEWLGRFMPGIPSGGSAGWLKPETVTDPSDGKLAHLDGLNLSRAWMLDGIASALPENDARRASLEASRDLHSAAGLASVTGEHYEGGHWLGSFATYLVTRRGITTAG